MTYTIIEGKTTNKKASGFIKRRVSYLANRPSSENPLDMELQMIGGFMMVRRLPVQANMPPQYQGPVAAAWVNLVQTYPDSFGGLVLMGALIAELGGQFEGHIDWVQQISEQDRKEVIDGLREAGRPIRTAS
jgi:hypothetical protein